MKQSAKNRDRAHWANAAVRAFMAETNQTEADGFREIVSDLICDLRHFIDREGLDWRAVLRWGDRTYAEETDGLCRCGATYCRFDDGGQCDECAEVDS